MVFSSSTSLGGPVRVLLALEVPRRAVVGEDEAVGLHGLDDRARLGAVAAGGEAGVEAEPRAHRRVGQRRRGAGVVPGRPEVVAARLGRGEADGVVDGAVADLLPAQQAGQDRQPGGVGGGPGVRAELVGRQRPHGAGAGPPGGAGDAGVPGLVELAGALVDDDGVHVAAGVAAALDAGVGTEGVLHLVALGRVVEPHPHLRVVAPDHGDRDPVVGPVAVRRPEVRVQVHVGRHVGEPVGRAVVDRQLADVGVPPVVGGERRAGRALPRWSRRDEVPSRRPAEADGATATRTTTARAMRGVRIPGNYRLRFSRGRWLITIGVPTNPNCSRSRRSMYRS